MNVEQSESIAKLATAMLAAQQKMKHPNKDATNPRFRSGYASLTSVIDTVVPVFNAEGIVVTQLLLGDCLVTQLTHTSGEYIRSAVELPREKQGPQAFGSALTYLRRYSIQAVAGVNAENDDDANGASADNKDW